MHLLVAFVVVNVHSGACAARQRQGCIGTTDTNTASAQMIQNMRARRASNSVTHIHRGPLLDAGMRVTHMVVMMHDVRNRKVRYMMHMHRMVVQGKHSVLPSANLTEEMMNRVPIMMQVNMMMNTYVVPMVVVPHKMVKMATGPTTVKPSMPMMNSSSVSVVPCQMMVNSAHASVVRSEPMPPMSRVMRSHPSMVVGHSPVMVMHVAMMVRHMAVVACTAAMEPSPVKMHMCPHVPRIMVEVMVIRVVVSHHFVAMVRVVGRIVVMHNHMMMGHMIVVHHVMYRGSVVVVVMMNHHMMVHHVMVHRGVAPSSTPPAPPRIGGVDDHCQQKEEQKHSHSGKTG